MRESVLLTNYNTIGKKSTYIYIYMFLICLLLKAIVISMIMLLLKILDLIFINIIYV